MKITVEGNSKEIAEVLASLRQNDEKNFDMTGHVALRKPFESNIAERYADDLVNEKNQNFVIDS